MVSGSPGAFNLVSGCFDWDISNSRDRKSGQAIECGLLIIHTEQTKTVRAWCEENIGQSVQAKRKKAFVSHDGTEQKRDQFSAV
ncbi:MAG: hypothetical protein J7K81_03745 [Methanophagales archaeon]|nr:hypothetical protein [Methanophagales archaeon]